MESVIVPVNVLSAAAKSEAAAIMSAIVFFINSP
jgi:hypothetical protein